ncbi:related to 50S ribosomal protein L17 [Ramularia collo-cygni]|uniref:Large ribosomal subunit protein bL17m n=1 Tax=Ramularia collo-cygni TaxID=112498 RepID=A0A2D3V2M0_9PEZI|nr:related to 50S ribosomal protein L17 [Ramularia collo-cygni]CZT20955.1 related to 50S ribosomal protein L17 [Ramularia collo-cygni]
MAGGAVKYRHLSRDSAHRRALLRNLVTSLIEHESIQTTWPKAKEAQRWAEKLITMGKKNTEASRQKAQGMIFTNGGVALSKVFGDLATRYASRPGGYTRVLRIEPAKEDQAPSAILELVDGPKDMRMALTAKTIANLRAKAEERGETEMRINDMTAHNVQKVTRFREGGEEALEAMVQKFEALLEEDDEGVEELPKKKHVYPKQERSRG